jgi:hypothetical protein
MATSSSNLLSAKVLRSDRDWYIWFGSIMNQAIQLEVWDYINPKKDNVLTEPIYPVPLEDADENLITLIQYKVQLYQYKWDSAT